MCVYAQACACELLFVCSFEPNILQLWSFPWLHAKPINKTRSHGKRVRRAVEKTASFWGRARHWLNLKEKLMDPFLLPLLLEQSHAPGAKKAFSG